MVEQDREGVGDTKVETEVLLASLNLAHLIPLFVLNGYVDCNVEENNTSFV